MKKFGLMRAGGWLYAIKIFWILVSILRFYEKLIFELLLFFQKYLLLNAFFRALDFITMPLWGYSNVALFLTKSA